jgi:hypothetical protein
MKYFYIKLSKFTIFLIKIVILKVKLFLKFINFLTSKEIRKIYSDLHKFLLFVVLLNLRKIF